MKLNGIGGKMELGISSEKEVMKNDGNKRVKCFRFIYNKQSEK